MKNYLRVGPWLAVALGCLALPDSASAGLRYRADGHICRAWNTDTVAEQGAGLGLQIKESPDDDLSDAVTCAIPTGVGLVDLGENTNMLAQINVRVAQEDVATNVSTYLIAHDFDSASACTCGHTFEAMNPGSFSQRSMPFDCGSCSYDEAWAVSLHISRTGGGNTLVKLISVYDE